MAAPKGAVYSPKSGPLAGQTFVADNGRSGYYVYQQARAKALGFSGYGQERIIRQSPAYKAVVAQERAGNVYGKQGVLPTSRRFDLLGIFGKRQNVMLDPATGKKTYRLAVDQKDHARGGSLDRFLIDLGRREGNEKWNPGETPH